MSFFKKRLVRSGIRKTIDEALYYALAHKVLKQNGERLQRRLVDLYTLRHGAPDWRGDAIHTRDINSPEVLQFVRDRSADLLMSMCINEFFRRPLRESTRLGAFLWHEGLVPEYKGLYSPFWAICNGKPGELGYTVLRMNERYDEGEVYVQGPVEGINLRTDSPVFIGHKAVLDSLPAVANLFHSLENDTAQPLDTRHRESATYTYPGVTDWLLFRSQLRRLTSVNATDNSRIAQPISAKDL